MRQRTVEVGLHTDNIGIPISGSKRVQRLYWQLHACLQKAGGAHHHPGRQPDGGRHGLYLEHGHHLPGRPMHGDRHARVGICVCQLDGGRLGGLDQRQLYLHRFDQHNAHSQLRASLYHYRLCQPDFRRHSDGRRHIQQRRQLHADSHPCGGLCVHQLD